MSATTQLLGISNAIVDILAHVDTDFIDEIGAVPGSMTLIDEDQAVELYARMGPATEMSGGSVANTVAGFANLGGRAAYIGKVRDDQLGGIFNHDMQALGVDIRLQAGATRAPTARSHVLITPDGQRTMRTYLGACTELASADIDASTLGAPGIILLEGYVWDIPEGPALAERAAVLGRNADSRVALSLSDSFCVERHRDAFRAFVDKHADIVIADEDEINALLETPDVDATLAALDPGHRLFAITRSEEGSVVVDREQCHVQQATPVERVVDTTGAGDAWCAGFLYGIASEEALDECARLGTFCATEVIGQVGARIEPGILGRYRSAC